MGAVPGAAPGGALAEAQPVDVYRPRQPRASPLYRLLDEHFQTFATVSDERFAPRWGPWRRVDPHAPAPPPRRKPRAPPPPAPLDRGVGGFGLPAGWLRACLEPDSDPARAASHPFVPAAGFQ